MNVRPHPVLHMIAWYCGSIALIVMMYGIMLSGFYGFEDFPFRAMLVFGVLWGVFLGIPLGFFAGIIMSYLTRGISAPYTQQDMQNHVLPPIMLFCFPLLIIALLTWLFTGFAINNLIDALMIGGFPVISGGFASAFAARRFLHRMTIWSANEMQRKSREKAKNKAKNASRLLDKEKNEDIFADDPLPQRRSRRQ